MHLKVVTDIKHFRDLRDEWNQLVQKTEPAGLALSHEWLFAWWQIFAADRKLNIILVYDEPKLVAIGPFLKERFRYRGIPSSRLQLMTNGHSPYCDLIVDNTASERKINEILQLIFQCDSADVLMFNKVPENSPMVRYLTEKASSFEFRYGIKPSLITPTIHISGEWEEFFRSKSRKFRKGLKNKLNRLDIAGDFSITCESISSRDNPFLIEMIDISKASWKRAVKNDLGSNAAAREFLFKLADVFGPGGHLDLWIMHKADMPVAFELHLDYFGVVHPIRADFSEKFKPFSPGSVLLYVALKSLFEKKTVSEYYSCAHNYRYLTHWSKTLKKHVQIEFFACSWKPQLLYMLEHYCPVKSRTNSIG